MKIAVAFLAAVAAANDEVRAEAPTSPTDAPTAAETAPETTLPTTEPPTAQPSSSAAVDLVAQLLLEARLELYAKGNPTAAISLLNAVVAKDETRAEAHRLLGAAWAQLGKRDEARKAYERFVLLSPPGPDVEQVRAVLQFLDTAPPAAGGARLGAVRIPPDYRVFYKSTLALRYNPLGLFSDNRIALRRLLYKSDNAAFNNNFVSLALFPILSPAFARFAIGAELQPASFLTLWGNIEFGSFFGTFNLMQSFPTATVDYSDAAISARSELPQNDPQRSFPALGTQINLGADLQFRLGPVALRNQFRAVRADYEVREGDVVYYEQMFDVLVPNKGWYINNDTDVLYLTDFGLTAGVRFNVANSFYGSEHLAADETLDQLKNGPQSRVGPLVAYTFWDDEGALFDRPTLFFLANWWLSHRFRTGESVSQAVPLVAIAFQMQGDLIPWNRPPPPPEPSFADDVAKVSR